MRLLFIWGLLLFSVSAQAAMIIDRAVVIFEAGSPARQDVIVSNPDPEPLYVKVDILEVINAGKENEERKPITDPRAKKLIVTPPKMIIPPGARKQVRLVNLAGHSDEEKVYRVNLTPVANNPELDEDETILKILVGYQLLVFVEPLKPNAEIIAKRNGKQLVLTNNGNNNVMLRSGKQCPHEDAVDSECKEINGKRLYPGATWVVDLPYDQPVEFAQSMGNKNTNEIFE